MRHDRLSFRRSRQAVDGTHSFEGDKSSLRRFPQALRRIAQARRATAARRPLHPPKKTRRGLDKPVASGTVTRGIGFTSFV
jgi:hypothetical protein